MAFLQCCYILHISPAPPTALQGGALVYHFSHKRKGDDGFVGHIFGIVSGVCLFSLFKIIICTILTFFTKKSLNGRTAARYGASWVEQEGGGGLLFGRITLTRWL
jgi:hypothetical protein